MYPPSHWLPDATIFERTYPGAATEVRNVRDDLAKLAADCPLSDDLILLASELATNAVLHSRSGHAGQHFTVRAALVPGEYARVEVIDQGGTWAADELDDEHGRGLAIVAAIAGDGNWGVTAGATACRAWIQLVWPVGPPLPACR